MADTECDSIGPRVSELLDDCQRVLTDAERPEAARIHARRWAELLGELENQTRTGDFRVVVIGPDAAARAEAVNQLLGSPVVPTEDLEGGRLAHVELRRGERSSARIRVATRDDWEAQAALLLSDLRSGVPELSEPARARLEAVYGASLRRYEATGVSSALLERPLAAKFLDQKWSGEQFLESTLDLSRVVHSATAGSKTPWSIISAVDVKGPFARLGQRVVVVDHPPETSVAGGALDHGRGFEDADLICLVVPTVAEIAPSLEGLAQASVGLKMELATGRCERLVVAVIAPLDAPGGPAVDDDEAGPLGQGGDTSEPSDDVAPRVGDASRPDDGSDPDPGWRSTVAESAHAEVARWVDTLRTTLGLDALGAGRSAAGTALAEESVVGDEDIDIEILVASGPAHTWHAHLAAADVEGSARERDGADELADLVGRRRKAFSGQRAEHAERRLEWIASARDSQSVLLAPVGDGAGRNVVVPPGLALAGEQLRHGLAMAQAGFEHDFSRLAVEFTSVFEQTVLEAVDRVRRASERWAGVRPAVVEAALKRGGSRGKAAGLDICGEVEQAMVAEMAASWIRLMRELLPEIVERCATACARAINRFHIELATGAGPEISVQLTEAARLTRLEEVTRFRDLALTEVAKVEPMLGEVITRLVNNRVGRVVGRAAEQVEDGRVEMAASELATLGDGVGSTLVRLVGAEALDSLNPLSIGLLRLSQELVETGRSTSFDRVAPVVSKAAHLWQPVDWTVLDVLDLELAQLIEQSERELAEVRTARAAPDVATHATDARADHENEPNGAGSAAERSAAERSAGGRSDATETAVDQDADPDLEPDADTAERVEPQLVEAPIEPSSGVPVSVDDDPAEEELGEVAEAEGLEAGLVEAGADTAEAAEAGAGATEVESGDGGERGIDWSPTDAEPSEPGPTSWMPGPPGVRPPRSWITERSDRFDPAEPDETSAPASAEEAPATETIGASGLASLDSWVLDDGKTDGAPELEIPDLTPSVNGAELPPTVGADPDHGEPTPAGLNDAGLDDTAPDATALDGSGPDDTGLIGAGLDDEAPEATAGLDDTGLDDASPDATVSDGSGPDDEGLEGQEAELGAVALDDDPTERVVDEVALGADDPDRLLMLERFPFLEGATLDEVGLLVGSLDQPRLLERLLAALLMRLHPAGVPLREAVSWLETVEGDNEVDLDGAPPVVVSMMEQQGVRTWSDIASLRLVTLADSGQVSLTQLRQFVAVPIRESLATSVVGAGSS